MISGLARRLALHMAESSWDRVLLQLTVTMGLAALCLQALLPRWRKLAACAKHRRKGGISPLTNSPPLLAGSLNLFNEHLN